MDFLLEIGSEEMPAAAVDLGIAQLKSNAGDLFDASRLPCEEVTAYGTPRRLTLLVTGLSERQESAVKEVKGPARRAAFGEDGSPTAAALGFAKSQGVAVESLEVRGDDGEYVFALKNLSGEPAVDVLPDIMRELISSLQFPKTMRWGEGDLRFIRPIRWILSLFGEKTVSFELDGLVAGNKTYGHRLLAPGYFPVKNVEQYFSVLEAGSVVLDQNIRRKMILDSVEAAADMAGGRADINPKVLEEVVNLVEHPQALAGTFPEEFLTIPREVVKMAMESHQRYFPVEKDGRLLPAFIAVQNGDAAFGDSIIRGHERVIRARLADAAFFFVEDTRVPLVDKVDELKGVVYQKKLGSIFDKMERVKKLGRWLADELDLSDDAKEDVSRAALLCKADLVTGMVGEFPELQGIIGREYALTDKEREPVAAAIAEHYMPRFAGDALPATLTGALLAIADKIDSIVGCFSVGLIPSGSQDPYALRRQAQGATAILAEFKLNLSLAAIVEKSKAIYKDRGIAAGAKEIVELAEFIAIRLVKHFTGAGYRTDQIEAVLSAGYDRLSEIDARLRLLAAHADDASLDDAKIAYTRCINISDAGLGVDVDPKLLIDEAELRLWQSVSTAKAEAEAAAAVGDLDKVLKIIAAQRGVIDAFFDAVLVMDEDLALRENRLRLLNNCAGIAYLLADLSKLI